MPIIGNSTPRLVNASPFHSTTVFSTCSFVSWPHAVPESATLEPLHTQLSARRAECAVAEIPESVHCTRHVSHEDGSTWQVSHQGGNSLGQAVYQGSLGLTMETTNPHEKIKSTNLEVENYLYSVSYTRHCPYIQLICTGC